MENNNKKVIVRDMMIGQFFLLDSSSKVVYELLFTEISAYGGSGSQEPCYTLYFRNVEENTLVQKNHDWDESFILFDKKI